MRNDKEIEIILSNPKKFDYLKSDVNIYSSTRRTYQEDFSELEKLTKPWHVRIKDDTGQRKAIIEKSL